LPVLSVAIFTYFEEGKNIKIQQTSSGNKENDGFLPVK